MIDRLNVDIIMRAFAGCGEVPKERVTGEAENGGEGVGKGNGL